MRTFQRLFSASLMVLFIGASLATPATLAGEFPANPIGIVIPWPAGTAPDVAMRILAEVMRDNVGQPVSVTNGVGGSGTKGFA